MMGKETATTATASSSSASSSSKSAAEEALWKTFEQEVHSDAQFLLSNYRNLLQLHATLSQQESLGKHHDLQVETASNNIVSLPLN